MVTENTTIVLQHLTRKFVNKGEAKKTKESQMVVNQVKLTSAQKKLEFKETFKNIVWVKKLKAKKAAQANNGKQQKNKQLRENTKKNRSTGDQE